MKANNKMISKALLVGAVAVLTGCAATQTVIEHRKLETNIELSKPLFLDPIPSNQKTIFIEVKNTSNENLELAHPLSQSLKNQGYRVLESPVKAHYLLQINVLKVGKMSQAASKSALGGGFGSALSGAATGAGFGSLYNTKAAIGSGLAGGLIGLAADSLVHDVNFTVITDVQISERVGQGMKVREQFQSQLANGTTTQTLQTSSKESQYQRYRTRIVSNADRVNLKFADAKSLLEHDLVKTIAGIF